MEHLIPQTWFDPLTTGILLLITVGALALLIKAADWLVEGAAGLAYRFGISKIIVGATVISLGTTSPEAAVSVMAAWGGNPGLALGNAVGSIIADTGLIFGIGCLMVSLPADRYVLSRQGWIQFGAAMLLAAICYLAFWIDGDAATLGRGVGILMLVLLLVYMFISIRWSRQHPDIGKKTQTEDDEEEKAAHSVLFLVAIIAIGLTLVILASRLLICSVSVVAVRWGVPQVVIAATLVALGTSLPELVVGMTSIAKGHKELLLGNVIGADILNVLFVIGASASAASLPIVEVGSSVPRIFLYLHLPTMVLILALFRVYIADAIGRGSFRRWFGLPLVLIYIAYVVAQFLLSVGGTTH
jgi:cation:H+ antiporter